MGIGFKGLNLSRLIKDFTGGLQEMLTRLLFVRELRKVYDDLPNSALKEIIEIKKKMHPEMRK